MIYQCKCGQKSEKLLKDQYYRLVGKVWVCEKCKPNSQVIIMPLAKGFIITQGEF